MENDNSGNGSVGGTKDGHAVRRADGWESPPSLGWLKGPAAESDPRGTGWTAYGPNSAGWGAESTGPFTTGMQRGRKKR